jgi:D-serine deaminase-like pyridoxal phosphate-dependent protein
MADYVTAHQLRLRPHTKTHKSLHVARLQLSAGASGLTVAKVGEAEIMSQATADLLLAYPTVDTWRCQRAAELAHDTCLRVAVDSRLAIERLSAAARLAHSTIGILIDVDVGFGRTGVQNETDAVALAQAVDQAPGLRLEGILVYTGHVLGPPEMQVRQLQELQIRLDQLLDPWDRHGLCRQIVSGGSTPAAFQSHRLRGLTEIRPGTYVFNDMNTVRGGYCGLNDCAARIHTTVVSTTVAQQVVIDAGSKTLTSDLCGPAPDSGYGHVVEYPEAKIVKLTEEHGQVDVARCRPQPQLGETLTIIPNHICVCVNMQDQFWWQDPHAPPQPLPVDARGRVV